MTYQQAKALLESKGQTQLLRYYDELDEAGKANLLAAIENINWDFEDDFAEIYRVKFFREAVSDLSAAAVSELAEMIKGFAGADAD